MAEALLILERCMNKHKWLLVGLGNPGSKYKDTRHNIGMTVLESFALRFNLEFKFGTECEYSELKYAAQDIILCKPLTYMNNSGIAVQKMLNKFGIKTNHLIVCVDEYNFPTGKIHLRASGSDGGHNGIASIIENIKTNDFIRLRIGIGKDFGPGEMANYVLSHFYEHEKTIVQEMIPKAITALEKIFKIGFQRAMSEVNAEQQKLFGKKVYDNSSNSKSPELVAPTAKEIPHKINMHSMELTDNYFWLRDKTNPKVINYLKAENKYAEYMMSDTKEIQDLIYNEIISSIQETDHTIPIKKGDYFYYSRTIKDLQYPIYCRKYMNLDSEEEILLDLNLLSQGKNYIDLGGISSSPDNTLLAYAIDEVGYEQYTTYIINIKSREQLTRIENTSGDMVWMNDSMSLLYTTINDIRQADKVYVHEISDSSKDKLIYQEFDFAYFLSLDKTWDESAITITLQSKDESEVWILDSNSHDYTPELIRKRENKIQYYVESHKDKYLIITNDTALNFKIVSTEKSNYDKSYWQDLLPYDESIKIENIYPFEEHLVILERSDGLQKIRIIDINSQHVWYIDFPDVSYSCDIIRTYDYNSPILWLSYTTLNTPYSVMEYNMQTKELILLKENKVLNGFNKNNYVVKREFVSTADNKQVPITICHKKGIDYNGNNPTLLTAYGAYGYSNDPAFSPSYLSLLNRGFIIAIAHVRGGGELGEHWYLDGKMSKKRNTFFDFIESARFLINNKYTSPEMLVIRGGSAGGLLIGAVLNQSPELFKTALAIVPFVDVLNTMSDPTIPLTIAEYSEWGNPQNKDHFEYIYSYSPYENIQRQNYPHILVRAGLNDPRVHYWEPAKWVAKLRKFRKDNNLLILVTEMESGHSGSSGRYSKYKEIAFDYAFILKTFEMLK